MSVQLHSAENCSIEKVKTETEFVNEMNKEIIDDIKCVINEIADSGIVTAKIEDPFKLEQVCESKMSLGTEQNICVPDENSSELEDMDGIKRSLAIKQPMLEPNIPLKNAEASELFKKGTVNAEDKKSTKDGKKQSNYYKKPKSDSKRDDKVTINPNCNGKISTKDGKKQSNYYKKPKSDSKRDDKVTINPSCNGKKSTKDGKKQSNYCKKPKFDSKRDDKVSIKEKADQSSDCKNKNISIKSKNSKENKDVEKTSSSFKKEDAYFNIFHAKIPLIGKSKFADVDDKPFNQRYDLAAKRNEARGIQMQKERHQIPEISFEKLMKQKNERTVEEVKADKDRKQREDLQMATSVTKVGIRILKLLKTGRVDEKVLARNFHKFLRLPVSPESLLYTPQFIHTIMFCRGNKNLTRKVRSLADECYQKCHCMFPVPAGSNFESVYSYLVEKTVPDIFCRMTDVPLEYGSFSESESEKE